MRKVTCLLCIIAFSCFAAYTQNTQKSLIEDDDYTTVVPPSPSAYELGKYGQIPVGNITGTPSISAPIYTYNAGKLSIPISVSYNSNGIKVDQLSSIVGLGWSLNAGGVITRVVNDLPDEEGYSFYPFSRLQHPLSITEKKYLLSASDETIDSEPDTYMYNFLGHSGKFTYNNGKELFLMPLNKLRIEKINIDGNTDFGFKVTDLAGIQYYFEEIEYNTTSTSPENKGVLSHIPSSWYLTTIIHPEGDTINLKYLDNTYSYDASKSHYYYRTPFRNFTTCTSGTRCDDYDEYKLLTNNSTINGQLLSEISSNKTINGKITFSYLETHPENSQYDILTRINIINSDSELIESISLDYKSTNNDRLFLDKLSYMDTTKFYKFGYIDPDGLCGRLSNSQDYWGYYNGVQNNSLLPEIIGTCFMDLPILANSREADHSYGTKGLLNKITYPTKGITSFEYEPNSYWGESRIYPPITYYSLVNCGEERRPIDDVLDTTGIIQFDQPFTIVTTSISYDTISCGFDPFECDSTHGMEGSFRIYDLTDQEHIMISHNTTNGWYPLSTNVTFTESSEYRVFLTEGHQYVLELGTTGACVRTALTMQCYDEMYTTIWNNIEVGGARIKRIINEDSATGLKDTTRYYYNSYKNKERSSGDCGNKGYYISNRHQEILCSGGQGQGVAWLECDFQVLQSGSVYNLFNTGSNNIYYDTVTVSYGGDLFEHGGSSYKYSIVRKTPGHSLIGDGSAQSTTAWFAEGWEHGQLDWQQDFKVLNNEQVLVRKIENKYTLDQYGDTNYCYSITKNWEPVIQRELFHVCTEADTHDCKESWVCSLSVQDGHRHHWNIPLFGETHCISPLYVPPFLHNFWDTVYCHPCVGKNVGDTLIFYDAVEHLNVIEYSNIAAWSYLSRTTQYDYDTDGSGEIETITTYSYDNPYHLQLTGVEKTESVGTTKTQIYYPDDYDSIWFDSLLVKNIVVPIDKRFTYEENLVDGTLLKYNDIGQPIEIIKADTEKGTSLSFNPNNPYSYGTSRNQLSYDASSNKLISFKNKDDIETTILWGYNYTKPIASIVNISSSQLLTVLNDLNTSYSDIQLMSSEQLLVFLKSLRGKVTLQDSRMTSYTYKPLVGMTSTTDENGWTTTYEYDEYNRLKTIRDHEGNILQHNEYNYQQD